MTHFTRWIRHAGPAMGFLGWTEALRAAFGILLALAAMGLLLVPFGPAGLYLIAPFGATAVILFALPNSPLAQPWSAVVGNTVSALVAVALVPLLPDPALCAAVATAGAVLAMHLARALHPPGGAVALTLALNPGLVATHGAGFALAPVAVGTAAMVLLAALYARPTGRRYPFRQPAETGAPETAEVHRLAVSRDELAGILRDFRQSANIGVEDLARMISAAEMLAARHQIEGVTCADIMSRDLVTVAPGTPLDKVARLFRRHGFTSLPVVAADGRYLGVIFQIHLIRNDAPPGAGPLGWLLRRSPAPAGLAGGVMATGVPSLPPGAPISAVLPLLAQGSCDAVPILEGNGIAGIVTRTDLIAALAHQQAV